MEFNKLISLVLGFIVAVLLIVWVVNRFRNPTANTTASKAVITATVTPTPAKKEGWNPFAFLFNKTTPTPTRVPGTANQPTANPTQVATNQQGGMAVTPTPQNMAQNNGQTQYNNQNRTVTGVTQIPNTGAPTLFLPMALSSLLGGIFLSRAKKS